MAEGTFATVINCMDGRTQLPVNKWVTESYHVDYIDTITEPGPDKIISEGPNHLIDSIKQRIDISVNKHGSKHVILVSHDDCAGNPVDKETHLKQLEHALHTMATWGYPAKLIGVWVDLDWKVHKQTEL